MSIALDFAYSQHNFTDEFYKACLSGDFEAALNFLKMGVNLNFRYENGKNLLHVACSKNFYGLVQLLIKFGCNEFIKDNFGRTTLHYAALNNSVSIIRYLIEKNIFTDKTDNSIIIRDFLNAQEINGKTVVHILTEQNYFETLKMVISLTNNSLADLDILDLNKKSALKIAYEKKHWDIFELLFKNNAFVCQEILTDICLHGNIYVANILLFSSCRNVFNVDWERLDDNGNTILYTAIKFSNNLELVSKLLNAGLRINLKDKVDLLEYIINLNESEKLSSENECFSYFIECFILLLKHCCFYDNANDRENSNQSLNINEFLIDIKYNKTIKSKIKCNKFLTMIFINFFYKILMNNGNSSYVIKFRRTFVYLFALAVFSGQLNIKEEYFRQWLEKLDSNNNFRFIEIYNESSTSPWSLQMICRVQIKKSFNHNLDYILKNSIVGKKLPNICIRYLKFDYI